MEPVLPPITDAIKDMGKLLAIAIDFSDDVDHTFVKQLRNLLVGDIEIPDEMITAGRYKLVIYELSILREDRLESIIVVLADSANNSVTVPQHSIDDILYLVRT
jgi:hypothetical protein